MKVKRQLFEVGLVAGIIAVVVMMMVPLAPWLIDLLIALNLGLSVLVLSLALFIRRPLALTAFPTLLLILTLYRLALNVSSTRLILLRADAGRIIAGFGGFIVGDDILVGAVLFGILALVLFLVITKGAERVAEVAARFTLDSLPGFQLAIDSDLRGGTVSPLEARRARRELDIQSRFYGSLDGAMKFVRGDAIASLLIVCVNICGGLAVGVLRHQMSLNVALDTYGRLTVGDGLVTMIPALLVSTAAGFLVTRVGQDSSQGKLGDQLAKQVFSEPKAIVATSGLLIVLCFVPDLPPWPFLLFGGGLAVLSLTHFFGERQRARRVTQPEFEWREDEERTAKVVLELGKGAWQALQPEAAQNGGLGAMGRRAAGRIREVLGVPIEQLPVIVSESDAHSDRVCLRTMGVVAHSFRLPREAVLVAAPESTLEHLKIELLDSPYHQHAWIPARQASLVSQAALSVFTPLEGVEHLAYTWLKLRAGLFFGIDEVQQLVHNAAASRPATVRETIPKLMGLPDLTELLRALMAAGVPLFAFDEVLEAIAVTEIGRNRDENLQRVRQTMSHYITAQLMGDQEQIEAMKLSVDLESIVECGIVADSRGAALALDSETCQFLIDACAKAATEMATPVLLVNPILRAPLARLLEGELPWVRVVAWGEIVPQVPVSIVSVLDM